MTNNLQESELAFLVEYKSDEHISARWLFKSRDKAKEHIKKELYLEYNKRTNYWDHKQDFMYAEIITLILKS